MNSTQYLTALENFISKLQQLPDADPKQISEAMAELCVILRLGKVEVVTYENPAAIGRKPLEANCFYDSGKACKSVCMRKRIPAIDEKITFYDIYSIEGAGEWTEEEQNRINTFIAVFSTFNEKIKLTKVAYHITYYDSDFDMYNLKQFMKCVWILSNAGQIDQFTAIRFNFKRFSAVNQYIGRENGTFVMKKFISLIGDLLDGENELLCRIGGDNFLTLVKSDKLQSVLDILKGRSIIYDNTQNERIFISATAGVYIIKDVGRSILPTDIMDRVSLAAHLAKESSDTDVVY